MRNRLFIVVYILFSSINSIGQNKMELNYNSIFRGRNIDVQYLYSSKNRTFSAGLLYHINNEYNIPYGSFFKNSANAENLSERLGLTVGFQYKIYSNDFGKLEFFYLCQLTRITDIHKALYAYSEIVENPTSEFDYAYIQSEIKFGPVRTMDNTLGAKLSAKLSANSYMNCKFGLGMMFWENEDESVILSSSPNQKGYLFTHFLSIGYGIQINQRIN